MCAVLFQEKHTQAVQKRKAKEGNNIRTLIKIQIFTSQSLKAIVLEVEEERHDSQLEILGKVLQSR